MRKHLNEDKVKCILGCVTQVRKQLVKMSEKDSLTMLSSVHVKNR